MPGQAGDDVRRDAVGEVLLFAVGGKVAEGQHCDRRTPERSDVCRVSLRGGRLRGGHLRSGRARGGRLHNGRLVSGRHRRCQRRGARVDRALHAIQRGDEAKAPLVDGADEALGLPVVPEDLSRRLDAAAQRRVRDHAPVPDLLEDLFLGDHAVVMLDQQREQLDHLRFDVQRFARLHSSKRSVSRTKSPNRQRMSTGVRPDRPSHLPSSWLAGHERHSPGASLA